MSLDIHADFVLCPPFPGAGLLSVLGQDSISLFYMYGFPSMGRHRSNSVSTA